MIWEDFIGDKQSLSWVIRFWPVLVCSFVCALAATWLCKRIALKLGIVDKPDNLVKTHKEPVAYLGGVGILVGLTVGILAGLYCIQEDEEFKTAFKWLAGVLGGASIACFVGLIDDIFDIKPKHKIAGQVVAALALIFVGIKPALNPFIHNGFLSWQIPQTIETILAVPIIIIFVVGCTNSLNLLDGLDGLCAGVTGIITCAMLLLAIHMGTWGSSSVGDPVRIIICLAMVGGVVGFLPFNRHPAKIFMGDAGSLLLGYIVAALMILFGEQFPRWWIASIVVFGLPILDTVTALLRRLINKKPLFVSDRGHIYDQMIDRGIPLKKTVTICYLLAGMYAMIGLAISQIPTRYAIIIYVLVFAISGLVIWQKGFLRMKGIRGAIQKDDDQD